MLVIVLGATRRNGPTGRSATREEELGPYSPATSPPRFTVCPPAVAALGSLVVYGIPTEIARVLATRNPERSAPLLLRVVAPIELLFVPLAAPIVWIGRLLEHKS